MTAKKARVEAKDLAIAATLAPLLWQSDGAELVLAAIRDHTMPVQLLPDKEFPVMNPDLLEAP